MKRKSLHHYFEQASAGVGSTGQIASVNCSMGKTKSKKARKKSVGAYILYRHGE